MSIQEASKSAGKSLADDLFNAARYYLGGRLGLIALGVVAVVVSAVLNWSWLVAAGIAPLLITALPCVAMCALGLCMNKMIRRAADKNRREDGGGVCQSLATVSRSSASDTGPTLAATADRPVAAPLSEKGHDCCGS
jgi:hypothetical protein